MLYNVIATGSTGNAVIYFDSVLVDCGVPYASLKPFVRQLRLILLTHEHSDHINFSTLDRLMNERPTLRIGCGEHMREYVSKYRNVDIYQPGPTYGYGMFSISPIKLYHDVPNFGYRLFCAGKSVIHATDTAHLSGITAKNYDLYAIEHNYNEDIVYDIIAEKTARGEFAHEKGSINTHLSEQQARDFIFNNKGENSQVLRLHETSIIKR